MSNGSSITGTSNIMTSNNSSNRNTTIITDETPELGGTGDILSDLNLS